MFSAVFYNRELIPPSALPPSALCAFLPFFKVDFSKRELIFFVLQKRIHTPCQAVTCVFILSFSFFSCFLQKRINFSVVFSKRELKLSVVFSKRELIFSVVFSKTELMFSVVFSKRELIPPARRQHVFRIIDVRHLSA